MVSNDSNLKVLLTIDGAVQGYFPTSVMLPHQRNTRTTQSGAWL